jgi:glucoamylase
VSLILLGPDRPAGVVARPGRRLAVLGLSFALLVALTGVVLARTFPPTAEVGLSSGTIAWDGDGVVREVPAGSGTVLPGTRVLAGTPRTAELVAAEQAWLAAGTVPAVPELTGAGDGSADLVRSALLDLHVLGATYGLPVAGWTGPWRYVWPRDSALVAAALARTGHVADADRVLTFLGRVQPPSGVFQARYRPDGSVPDARGTQLDGSGWALWATAEVAQALPPAQRPAFVARHRALLDRSTAAALHAIDDADDLPPASADYWEVPEHRTTLATAALLRAGLEAAATLEGYADQPAAVDRDAAAAHRLGAAVTRRFGPDGYPRRLGGRPGSVDLGVAFLLPPFAAEVDPDAHAAFLAAAGPMARPAGGLAPGGSWRRDGVSWTTATSSYALAAAASGDRAVALDRLRWLAAHRTAEGSLPEKVLADGRPAAVAPLGWTAAAVVLAADELARPE